MPMHISLCCSSLGARAHHATPQVLYSLLATLMQSQPMPATKNNVVLGVLPGAAHGCASTRQRLPNATGCNIQVWRPLSGMPARGCHSQDEHREVRDYGRRTVSTRVPWLRRASAGTRMCSTISAALGPKFPMVPADPGLSLPIQTSRLEPWNLSSLQPVEKIRS